LIFLEKEDFLSGYLTKDVSLEYNILKKAFPKALSADGIEDIGFHPHSISIFRDWMK